MAFSFFPSLQTRGKNIDTSPEITPEPFQRLAEAEVQPKPNSTDRRLESEFDELPQALSFSWQR